MKSTGRKGCFWLAPMNFGKSISFLLWTDIVMTSISWSFIIVFDFVTLALAKSSQWDISCPVWLWSCKIWTNHRALVLATTERLRVLSYQLLWHRKSALDAPSSGRRRQQSPAEAHGASPPLQLRVRRRIDAHEWRVDNERSWELRTLSLSQSVRVGKL